MVFVLCPFVTLASVERRDTYLPLLRSICEETEANEPECLAYCWMKENAENIDPTAKDVYVQGLEVYANDDALAVTHRSKEQYKHMRKIVAANPIITFPVEGLTHKTPAGVGFLSKSDSTIRLGKDTFVCLLEYTTSTIMAHEHLLAALETLSHEYASQKAYKTVVAAKVDQVQLAFESTFPGESVKTGLWDGAGFGFIRGKHFKP